MNHIPHPASGSLFGLAYGDALGKPTEFLTLEQIIRRYGPAGPRELVGDPALVTDDTQLALAVGWALHDVPSLDPQSWEQHLRERFVAWSTSPDNDRAPGRTCLVACERLGRGVPWPEAAELDSKGCGANMRVTPVGLLDCDLDTLAGAAQLQAALTHGHPTALAASELTALTVWALRRGTTLPDIPRLLRTWCRQQRIVYHESWLGPLWQRAGVDKPTRFIARGWDECLLALERVEMALASPVRGDPCMFTGAGWVAEEALATALLCAVQHEDDPVAGLARAASTSGDSDSIASLTGAFLGAALGIDAWPPHWRDRIEYADQLAALGRHFDGR